MAAEIFSSGQRQPQTFFLLSRPTVRLSRCALLPRMTLRARLCATATGGGEECTHEKPRRPPLPRTLASLLSASLAVLCGDLRAASAHLTALLRVCS